VNRFANGATWLRADFHLHTRADKEFEYSGDENYYCSSYVEALESAGIAVGVITNHNKFDIEEFKALRKNAQKKDIFLLPGVELSVGDGANGVHTIIVFSNDWINDGDYINQFLNVAFEGKTPLEYEKENGRSSLNILEAIKKLNGYQREFFIIFAHVEDHSGLWQELNGGRLQELGKNTIFRQKTLGFQKVRTHDKPDVKCRRKIQDWFADWYPAEVEGSDPKKIECIGRGKACFLKLGDFTFDSVRFALIDNENRLRSENAPTYKHSHIKQLAFTGGRLDGQTITFSPELNTLIGIRGSGKSSILECIRYALDIPTEDNRNDGEYKRKLIESTLGSGGVITLDAIGKHGQPYQIRRIFKDRANVFANEVLQPGVSIRETVLRSPLFFGQKEIPSAEKGSKKDLIEKILGTKCDDIRSEIDRQKNVVIDIIDKLFKVRNTNELIQEQENIKSNAEHILKLYKKHNLEEKLQKRLDFDNDARKAQEGVSLIGAFAEDIRGLLAKYEDDLRNFIGYSSKNNSSFFKVFDDVFSQSVRSADIIKLELEKVEAAFTKLEENRRRLIENKNSLSEEFAAIERTISEEIKTEQEQDISTSEFLLLKDKLSKAESALETLKKISDQKNILQNAIAQETQKLKDLWHKEFLIIKNELDAVSEKNVALMFSVGFKEDKDAFISYLQNIFRGSGLREVAFTKIVEKYQDFSQIYEDIEGIKDLLGGRPAEAFIERFMENLKSLLTYQPPNKFTIEYHGVELSRHSLGQRASALILFILGNQENDVIIIDQPEDDLDNQTIYEDVIKLVLELKPKMQFIFATHNPNIPVLGDAEQIHACSFSDQRITVKSGGLDNTEQQKRIVAIMEGGKEAFERRKEIYKVWRS
jgi:ABC-type cobalamin/Fe3+-siderophores transport system ATPase subunit